jgi:hypothetical protein
MTHLLQETRFALALALVFSLSNASVAAEPTTQRRAETIDIALSPNGQLIGRITGPAINAANPPVIELWQNGQMMSAARTAQDSSFVFQRIKGGCYRLVVNRAAWNCRIWSADAAPPYALRGIVVQLDNSQGIVRGQGNYSPFPFPRAHRKAMTIAALAGLGWGIYELLDDEPGS